MARQDSNREAPVTRRRGARRTAVVLAVIAGIIYAAFIGRGVFGG
ncbi:hypothetical protein [Wenzhouxiangella sp. XN79A]|nr:hypothetical protein [Wenzhouxiangella sp. XN79A]